MKNLSKKIRSKYGEMDFILKKLGESIWRIVIMYEGRL
jgi:Holliday junction resolvase-like predicted endonuclease